MARRLWPDTRCAQPAFAHAKRVVAFALVVVWAAPRSAFAANDAPPEQSVSSAVELLTLNPCLVRPLLIEEIEDWLERNSVDARLRVKVGEENGTLRFSIALAGGERSMHQFPDLPGDCAGQRRAVALSIALAIDAISPVSARPKPNPSAALAAYGSLSTALPERVGEGGGVLARKAVSRWFWPSLGVFVGVAPNQVLRAALPVRFDTWLAAVRVEGCFVVPAIPKLDFVACAGPWLGSLTTVAHGIADAGSDTEFWGAMSAALELHVRLLPAFGFHVGGDGVFAIRRSKVQVNTSEGLVAAERELPRTMGMLRFGPVVFF
jgi:hypothetical protein